MYQSKSLLFQILFVVFFTSCGKETTHKNQSKIIPAKIDTIVTTDKNVMTDTIDYNYAIYYVVVADTSLSYSILHRKMVDLNHNLKIPIDTLGRYYNKSKNRIVLPDNDEDKMYAGEYYPRRFPADSLEYLSLEYLTEYQEAGMNTIALVTGIYETEKRADSILTILKKREKKAFKIKANIYVGCMH